MRTTNHPPSRVAVTIRLPPAMHKLLSELALAQRMSLSKVIVDWLLDTGDALQSMATLVATVKERPRLAISTIEAHTAALQAVSEDLLRRLRASGTEEASGAGDAGGAPSLSPPPDPPPGNTGGTSARRKGRRP